MKDSTAEQQKARKREMIAKKFEAAMETLDSDTDILEFLKDTDPSYIKYCEAKANSRKQFEKIVRIIDSMNAYEYSPVNESTIPLYIRKNGFIANVVKSAVEEMEIISRELNRLIKEVHAKYETTLDNMEPPETILRDEAEEESEADKKVWRTWFYVYEMIEEDLPEDARVPWNNYCHYKEHPRSPNSSACMAEAAEEFKAATGFDIEEVYQFRQSLD